MRESFVQNVQGHFAHGLWTMGYAPCMSTEYRVWGKPKPNLAQIDEQGTTQTGLCLGVHIFDLKLISSFRLCFFLKYSNTLLIKSSTSPR